MICPIGTTRHLAPKTTFFPCNKVVPTSGVSWEGWGMLGKEWGRVELDLKEPQQPHLAGGQAGAREGCLGPCRRRQAPSRNVG